jgi:alpha-mannosidase
MRLSLEQRLNRLETRLAELDDWRARERINVNGWKFDGTPINLGEPWPHRRGMAHFTATAEAPSHWSIEETRLSLNVGGESLLTLTYEDGETVRFGLDPNHEEFPLRHPRFSIAIESVARLPFGEPVRTPHLNRAALIWLDRPVDRLRLLLQQVSEAAKSLIAHEAAPHLLTVAEHALRSLDWPSATADYVGRIAEADSQRKIWQLPKLLEAPRGLNEAERASVERAFDNLAAALRDLQRRFPPQGELALTGHAHIDLAWLWPYHETRRKLRRTFYTALSLIEASNDFRFNQSTAHFYAQVAEDDPELFAKIVEKVKSGKWETVGGMWVEPDTNMPTGESLARQILYGQRYFEKTFGARHTVCWLPDCFGFSPALPQLLKQGGIESFFTTKVNWSETNRFPWDLFWWEGLDGSRVLAHTFDNPMQGYNGFVHADCLAQTWKNFRGKTRHPVSLLSVGYGDGGGGVTPEMIEREAQLRDFPALPRARWTTVRSFFEEAHKSAIRRQLPVWVGEIYLELHRGTLTTQSGVKRKHRAAEHSLTTAETVGSLAHLLGAKAPQSLEPLWRIVLKNEFHDILPGSSIREVYQDAEAELDQVIEDCRAVQQAGMEAIMAHLPKGGADEALVVVNPSLSPKTLRATLEDGTAIATGDNVPPLGVAVFDRSALRARPGLSVSGTTLENAVLSATIGSDGAIGSLIHKATGRQALAGRGNQLWAYPVDKPRNWDAWDVDEDYAERGEELTAVESIEVIETGPHRAAIRVRRRYRASAVVQTIALAANSRRLDIETEIEWRDRRVFLRTLTPAAVRSAKATFECAYGVIERPTHTNTSWDAAMFEAPAHRFIDLSEPGFGVALMNNAKYGHSVRGDVLGMSLLRSPVYPDPLADEGAQSFVYALMPHAGDWHEGGVREEAEDLNQPLLTARGEGLALGVVTPIVASGINAALSALKPAEDSDGLVLRVYEPAGGRGAFSFLLPPNWTTAGPLNLLEEPAAHDNDANMKPFEVRSWRLVKR